MTVKIEADMTVGQLAARHPAARRVLESHGVDYCCGGDRALGVAAAAAGADADALLEEIRLAVESPPAAADVRDWPSARAGELVEHVLATHHAYLREALPRIEQLLGKVRQAHAERHGEMLSRLASVFAGLKTEIEMHLMKEEQVLFPYIRGLDAHAAGEAGPVASPCGTVAHPIRQMRLEHEHAAEALGEMRRLTGGYAPADDACESFRSLYASLAELEADLHQHIHLENNILFPRAIELEAAAQAPSAGD